jgi:hypothetical protein
MHGSLNRSDFVPPRGLQLKSGRFGRMFPHLPKLNATADAVTALGNSMKEPDGAENDPTLDNPDIPSGFTYLGQFIDHDITFDPTSLPERDVDPQAVHNFRTAKLDLDNLYGLGPDDEPYLYVRDGQDQVGESLPPGARPLPHGTFLLGRCGPSPSLDPKFFIAAIPNDLPRAANKFATIGDPRNDENLVVAQLHLAMLKFHNKVLTSQSLSFDDARRIVTWHYQWIVVHDFVKRIVDPAVLDDVLVNGRKFYHFGLDPFIPVEFSSAAYRLGHSMVRSEYDHNINFGPPPGQRLFNAKLETLFRFTGRSSDGSRMPLPSDWAIDWQRFFELSQPSTGRRNQSRLIDPLIASPLFNLPDGGPPLPVRNLIRGLRFELPSGQSVATAMSIPRLTTKEISQGPDGAEAAAQGLVDQTPLWYYILKEAQVHTNGKHLGAVGSRIVAEVFIGLLQGDPHSYLSQAPNWKPTLPGKTAGEFTFADLLKFVGDINPVEDPANRIPAPPKPPAP